MAIFGELCLKLSSPLTILISEGYKVHIKRVLESCQSRKEAEMNKGTRIVIGATLGIIAILIILGSVFHVDVQYGLGFIGFVFLIALPAYIYYTKDKYEQHTITTNELIERLRAASDEIEETQELLYDSIEKFQEWGRYLKDFEREDEKAYYSEIALWRESGFDSGRLSSEYGQDISQLIKIRRNLTHIRYLL